MSPPQFFETKMGRQFYEKTVPRLTDALEKIAQRADTFAEKAPAKKTSPKIKFKKTDKAKYFKDEPYVNLEIPNSDLTVRVKLEGEGVMVDVYLTSNLNDLKPQTVASVWKGYGNSLPENPTESAGEDDE